MPLASISPASRLRLLLVILIVNCRYPFPIFALCQNGTLSSRIQRWFSQLGCFSKFTRGHPRPAFEGTGEVALVGKSQQKRDVGLGVFI